MLEKPEEIAVYRQTDVGGLGLFHVQHRVLPCLINSFLETACNSKYIRNQYHQALLQYHVLGYDIPIPEIPHFFRGDFFPAIRRIHSSPLNIAKITLKQIYKF